jgi:hypothetical protein
VGKSVYITPLYLSVAWTLMISYQLFTQTAVTTVVESLEVAWPAVGRWLVSRLDMIVFICAFAWVFVLSSVVPPLILGKNRGVLIQFLVVLVLTFVSFIIQDGLITVFNGETIDQIFSFAGYFRNLFVAVGYLLLPYIVMLALDLRSRRPAILFSASPPQHLHENENTT